MFTSVVIDDNSDTDEYDPNEGKTVKCGVPGCGEDIFIACHIHKCKTLVCYDHRYSKCEEHSGQALQEEELHSTESDSSSTENKDNARSMKRKRERRSNLSRHHHAYKQRWKKNKTKKGTTVW